MTDANNHSTQYHYEASTDRLTGVSATASGQTRDVSYTYDEGDRIKSIKHGGTTYAFDYDGFGNQTMVKAGDKTLERYGYAPNNGPLITVAYGNGIRRKFCMTKRSPSEPDDGREKAQMPCVMSMMTTVHWKRKPIW